MWVTKHLSIESLLTKHPKQNGGKWMLVPDLFLLKVLKRLFEFPEYSELKSIETIDDHGDLETWEGTTVKLSLIANRPLKSGKLEFQWVEKPGEFVN